MCGRDKKYQHLWVTTVHPYGGLLLVATNRGIGRLLLGGTEDKLVETFTRQYGSDVEIQNEQRSPWVERIVAYLQGSEHDLSDLPLDIGGTPFQRTVWEVLRAIDYGKTRTYGDIAHQLKTSARAVGGACAQNPVPLLIPCHRVVASRGKLGGYVDTEIKRALLDLERG